MILIHVVLIFLIFPCNNLAEPERLVYVQSSVITVLDAYRKLGALSAARFSSTVFISSFPTVSRIKEKISINLTYLTECGIL